MTKERLALGLALALTFLIAGCGDESLSNKVRPQPSPYKHTGDAPPRGITNQPTAGSTGK